MKQINQYINEYIIKKKLDKPINSEDHYDYFPETKQELIKNIEECLNFNNYNCVSSYYLIIHMLISVLLTFIVCLIVEGIRKLTLELFYNKFISKRVDNISEKLNNFYLKLVNNFVK